jgi:hypothetical protein
MQQQARQDLEVGDGFLPEFEGTGKGGIRKLGSIGEIEPKHRPYYPANISRRRRVSGVGDATFPDIRKKGPNEVEIDREVGANKSCSIELLINLLGIILLELLRAMLLGGLLILQVAAVVISEAGK